MPIRVLVSVIEPDNRLLVWRRELSSLPLAPSDRRYRVFRRDGGGKGGG